MSSNKLDSSSAHRLGMEPPVAPTSLNHFHIGRGLFIVVETLGGHRRHSRPCRHRPTSWRRPLRSCACRVIDDHSITSYPRAVDRSVFVFNLDLIEEREPYAFLGLRHQ